jgi:hypothetical protein
MPKKYKIANQLHKTKFRSSAAAGGARLFCQALFGSFWSAKKNEEKAVAYAQAITDWVVEDLSPGPSPQGRGESGISVTFPSGNMTHGGSNAVSVFNADQKAVIKTFERTRPMEKDVLYLFFVADVKGKDGLIGGYMPLQRQAGFIYDVPNNELIAHELAHGAFNLRHTFSTEENTFIAAQNTTEN